MGRARVRAVPERDETAPGGRGGGLPRGRPPRLRAQLVQERDGSQATDGRAPAVNHAERAAGELDSVAGAGGVPARTDVAGGAAADGGEGPGRQRVVRMRQGHHDRRPLPLRHDGRAPRHLPKGKHVLQRDQRGEGADVLPPAGAPREGGRKPPEGQGVEHGQVGETLRRSDGRRHRGSSLSKTRPGAETQAEEASQTYG